MTQCQEIIEYLDQNGSITPAEAFVELNIYRLAARISDLRRQGYKIETEIMSARNWKGKLVHFARYKKVA